MANFVYRVTGLNSTIKHLTELGVEVSDLRKLFGELARQGARIVQTQIPVKTGRLRRSVKSSTARNYAVVTIGSPRVPYAKVIAWGWPKRNIRADLYPSRADEIIRPTVLPHFKAEVDRLIRSKGMQ